jgi:nitroimidazol reductase NimA-like FMN-containing flavoprotein (pyridoxamine 5'-phosphate oxidase superfamily)
MPLIDNGLEILSPEQCHDLLRRNDLGRIAVTVAALPAIFPVNYALLDGDIVFRTGEGTKLRVAVEQAVVAFQIDHYDRSMASGWSVMAIGLAQEVTDPDELERVRRLGLRPFAAGERSHYIRIRPEFLSGRRIT